MERAGDYFVGVLGGYRQFQFSFADRASQYFHQFPFQLYPQMGIRGGWRLLLTRR